MLLPLLAASVCLASVPFGWVAHRYVARRRGRARPRAGEGPGDGVALLLALLCATFTLLMAGVSLVRVTQEQHLAASATTVSATIDRCSVETSRGPGRGGGTSHSLTCEVDARLGGRRQVHTVTAGYLGGRTAYDDWMRRHPPGSSILLQLTPGPARELTGFEHIAPATTTAAGAARDALKFALSALLLFALSRGIVFARERP